MDTHLELPNVHHLGRGGVFALDSKIMLLGGRYVQGKDGRVVDTVNPGINHFP